jgi:hypothetical protein
MRLRTSTGRCQICPTVDRRQMSSMTLRCLTAAQSPRAVLLVQERTAEEGQRLM